MTTGKVDIDDLAASTAVPGVTKGGNRKRKVFHDSTRLLPSSESVVRERVQTLHDCREALIKRKIALETPQADPRKRGVGRWPSRVDRARRHR